MNRVNATQLPTIHVNAFINMLYAIMCPEYDRIKVEFGACTKWTVHVKCGMFWTVSIRAPHGIIAVF